MACGQDYDRSQLIPKVTRLMNDTDDGLSHGAGRKQAEVLQAVGRSSDRKRPDPEETVILADDGDSAPVTASCLQRRRART